MDYTFKGKQISDLLTLQDRNASIYSLGLQPRLQYYHFGSAVSTRLSDVVNQTAFDAVHLPHKYTKITARRVLEVQPYLEQQDFGGATISTPLKVNISQVCDSLSPQARVVGAVNSLVTVRDPWTLCQEPFVAITLIGLVCEPISSGTLELTMPLRPIPKQ